MSKHNITPPIHEHSCLYLPIWLVHTLQHPCNTCATPCNTHCNTGSSLVHVYYLFIRHAHEPAAERAGKDSRQSAFLLSYYVTYCNCNTLQHTATHCNTHCNTLQPTATHDNTRQPHNQLSDSSWLSTQFTTQDTETPYNTLQHTATRCNTLQHAATHDNTRHHTISSPIQFCSLLNLLRRTLQHTATHCNTRQHMTTHNQLSTQFTT